MMFKFLIGAFSISLFLAASGCGKDSCSQDTDCKAPQICVGGACVPHYQTDGVIDVIYDLDVSVEEPKEDFHELPPEIFPEETPEIVDDDGGGDVLDMQEEDYEEIELPPANIVWEEDFTTEPPDRWVPQLGTWSVVGGEYTQSSYNSWAESWVPDESWADMAVEVSVIADALDLPFSRNVLGVLFRVQQVARNQYYLCGIDYKNQELILMMYNQEVPPGYELLCDAGSLDPELATERWYKLQASVMGNLISCRWLVDDVAQVEISARDDTYTEGSIGLLANHAAGRFDNIIVWDSRPPEWPSADRRESCP